MATTLNGQAQLAPAPETDHPASAEGLTVAEAAVRLGLSKTAVRHKIRRGSLAACKDVAGEWRIPQAAIAAATISTKGEDGPGAAPGESPAAYAAARAPEYAAGYAAAHPPDGQGAGDQRLTLALEAAHGAEIRRLETLVDVLRSELEVRREEQAREREAHQQEVAQLHTLLARGQQLALPPTDPQGAAPAPTPGRWGRFVAWLRGT